MSKQTWNSIINSYLVASNGNYHLAVKMAKFHNDKLFAGKADPNVDAQYVVFHPLYLQMQTTYDSWIAQGSSQLGESLAFKLLIKQLSNPNIGNWDRDFLKVFPAGTADYKKLMPNHRTPFQTGARDDRITALSALSLNLIGIVPLAATATEINNFLLQIKAELDIQQHAIETTKIDSTGVEAARVAMCIKMFGNFGRLLGFNETDPSAIATYFPLKYIQHSQQVYFSHTLKKGAQYDVVKHSFLATDQILLTTDNAASIRVALAKTKGADITGKGVVVLGNISHTVNASDLGDTAQNSFLIVLNLDTNMSAEFEIEFL